MNEAMNRGEIEPGILVDFQGSGHLSCKSFFFDNPAYAMEVVLANVHEILASHPEVEDTDDVLEKLANMDSKTWQWVFEFIGKIPFAKVAEPTKTHNSVERGENQRPISEPKFYSAIKHMNAEQEAKMKKAIELLDKVNDKNNST